jgi:hypothetical protein
MAIGLTDTVMLGRYDKTALAASVLGNTVYLFCWFIGLGPASAIAPMIAHVLGARPDDRTETAAIVRMGLWSVLLMSVPLVGASFCRRIKSCCSSDRSPISRRPPAGSQSRLRSDFPSRSRSKFSAISPSRSAGHSRPST